MDRPEHDRMNSGRADEEDATMIIMVEHGIKVIQLSSEAKFKAKPSMLGVGSRV